MGLFSLVLVAILCVVQASALQATAWQNEGDKYSWPELTIPEVAARSNSAILFSGGGSRSYTATMGYLAGLRNLGLLEKVRYIAGISGGSWASTVYTFASADVAPTDGVLLGNVTAPADLTWSKLSAIDKGCARGAPVNGNFFERLLSHFFSPSTADTEIWIEAVQDVFMSPAGIPSDELPALSATHLADILQRNPSLSKDAFVLPREGRPFLIVGVDLLGPAAAAPFNVSDRSYTMFEISPLYAGQAVTQSVTYHGPRGLKQNMTVGGFVETFAFGGGAPASPVKGPSAMVDVSAADKAMSPARSAALSSFAPGDFISTLGPQFLADSFVPRMPYWSPADTSPALETTMLGDGGDLENPHLIGFLQRKVASIVLFCSFQQILNPEYDPSVPPKASDIDGDLPGFFGYFVDKPGKRGWDISRNQVFAQEDWHRVAAALMEAQASGDGTIATVALETVENKWWGIRAGQRVNTTWVYLDRVPAWESELPKDLSSLILPSKPADRSARPKTGPFKKFPNYSTGKLHLSAEEANLLADLCGWVVEHNAEMFKKALLV